MLNGSYTLLGNTSDYRHTLFDAGTDGGPVSSISFGYTGNCENFSLYIVADREIFFWPLTIRDADGSNLLGTLQYDYNAISKVQIGVNESSNDFSGVISWRVNGKRWEESP